MHQVSLHQKDKAAVEHNQWLDVSKESNGDFKTLPMELKITATTAQESAQVDLTLTTMIEGDLLSLERDAANKFDNFGREYKQIAPIIDLLKHIFPSRR